MQSALIVDWCTMKMKPLYEYAVVVVTHGLIWSVHACLKVKFPVNLFVKIAQRLFNTCTTSYTVTADC